MVWELSTRRNCATKHCNYASMPVRLAKPFPFSLTEIGQIFAQNVITSRKHCRHSLASSLLLAEEECHSFSKGKMPNRCSSECLVMETEGEQNLLFALFILQELNPPAWLSNYCDLMCYLFAQILFTWNVHCRWSTFHTRSRVVARHDEILQKWNVSIVE